MYTRPQMDWSHRMAHRVLDCGGKRSATPLSHARGLALVRTIFVRPKAVSPLRSATAVQDLAELVGTL
jgi:hypothetical protein